MNKKSMKWSAAILSAGLLVGNASFLSGQSEAVVAAATSVKASDVVMKYNGKTLSASGKLVNGNTMIPISVLRDDLGLKLSYQAGKDGFKTYTVGSGVTQMKLKCPNMASTPISMNVILVITVSSMKPKI